MFPLAAKKKILKTNPKKCLHTQNKFLYNKVLMLFNKTANCVCVSAYFELFEENNSRP